MSVLNVIDFNGVSGKKWLVYKHSENEFNTKSKLVVRPGQVAVVIFGGKVEGVFENGTYELTNVNLPFINNLQKEIYSGKQPFMMDVYFVNRTLKLDMLWGTKDPIQLLDPKFKVKINVRARAQYALRIKNYGFLITELIGALKNNQALGFDGINNLFRSIINTRIKTLLAQQINNKEISILDINIYLEELAQESLEKLKPDFEKYGMELVNFYYESINIPEGDLDKINEFLNRNAEFNILGEERYRTSRGYDVLDQAASNEGGAGGMASAGLGIGAGFGIAKEAANITNESIKENKSNCIKCNKELKSGQKFCSDCGTKQTIECSNCQKELKATANFCPSCGTAVNK